MVGTTMRILPKRASYIHRIADRGHASNAPALHPQKVDVAVRGGELDSRSAAADRAVDAIPRYFSTHQDFEVGADGPTRIRSRTQRACGSGWQPNRDGAIAGAGDDIVLPRHLELEFNRAIGCGQLDRMPGFGVLEMDVNTAVGRVRFQCSFYILGVHASIGGLKRHAPANVIRLDAAV